MPTLYEPRQASSPWAATPRKLLPIKCLRSCMKVHDRIGTFFAQGETSVSYHLAHYSRSVSYIWEARKAIPTAVGKEWTPAKIAIEEVRLPRYIGPEPPSEQPSLELYSASETQS